MGAASFARDSGSSLSWILNAYKIVPQLHRSAAAESRVTIRQALAPWLLVQRLISTHGVEVNVTLAQTSGHALA
jgi:hypothetical protein